MALAIRHSLLTWFVTVDKVKYIKRQATRLWCLDTVKNGTQKYEADSRIALYVTLL